MPARQDPYAGQGPEAWPVLCGAHTRLPLLLAGRALSAQRAWRSRGHDQHRLSRTPAGPSAARAMVDRGPAPLPAPPLESEGFHGEAKTWHGLARAVRRGLGNMRIQAFLTAAAINLKRLAAALLALLWRLVADLCRPEAAAAHRQSALWRATALSPERRRAYRSNLSSSTTPGCSSDIRLRCR